MWREVIFISSCVGFLRSVVHFPHLLTETWGWQGHWRKEHRSPDHDLEESHPPIRKSVLGLRNFLTWQPRPQGPWWQPQKKHPINLHLLQEMTSHINPPDLTLDNPSSFEMPTNHSLVPSSQQKAVKYIWRPIRESLPLLKIPFN